MHSLRLGRQTLCLPGRFVPVDQTAMPPTDNCCYLSCYQISQSCSTVHQNTNLERLLPRPNSTGVPRQGHAHTQLFGRGHLQIHGDTEPSLVVLGEQATMEKTTQRFQKIATTLADLNAEGLNVQTVNDLLTMYVGAASQHVLRMSFVPEQEAQNFDGQVLTFWSRLMHRDITSQLFFLPLKLGGFGVGSAVQRHAAAPWRAWQSVIPSLMTTTQSPDTDSLFSSTPQLRAQLAQLQTTLSLTSKETSTNNYTTASSIHPLNKPYSCHNPFHIPVRISCSRAVKRTRLRIAAFVSQFPEDDAPAPGSRQPCRCGTVLPLQKCGECHQQQTSGPETAALLRLSAWRRC